MRRFVLITCFSISLLIATEPSAEARMHALFLMQNGEIEQALERYQNYCHLAGRYDFETLQQMGLIMLQKGADSLDPQTYLMTLFGAGISGNSAALDILERGLHADDPQIQLLALHFIAQIEDDRTHALLEGAMSSNFLSSRMEAAYFMAQKKHPHALGQIEGLMMRLPPAFKPYFPPFFVLLGTSDATQTLKRLLEDIDPQVRIEAILNIAKSGRDDFLPILRRRLAHSHIAENEAAIFAVGVLKDSASLPKLKKLSVSPIESIRLAACHALLHLGDRSYLEPILEMASHHHLFAILSLGLIPGGEETLVELTQSSDFQVRINAAIALLQRHDARCLPVIYDILISDSRDLAFYPMASIGRTYMAFKTVSSAELRAKDPTINLGYSTALREQFLRESIHLPEEAFLQLARTIFQKQQNDLVPTLISLLENLRTDGAIKLLKEGSQKMSSPLIRDYCNLSLYRLKTEGHYEEYINYWVGEQKNAELIRLRPFFLGNTAWNKRTTHLRQKRHRAS